jgi:uncharacterized protein
MLIEFSITNFRSIRERQTFSMETINKFKELPKNISKIQNSSLLRTAAIYGKNASGKSNFVLAFKALTYIVEKSATFKMNSKIKCYEPYEFDKDSDKEPVIFETLFYGKDNIKYYYKIAFNEEKILDEQLVYYPKKQPTKLFKRDESGNIEPGDIIKNKIGNVSKTLFLNQLFLSKVSTEKIEELIMPYLFFEEYLFVNILQQTCSLCDKMLIDIHTERLFKSKDETFRQNINKLFRIADTGINGIYIKENKEDDFEFPDTIDPEKRKRFIEENRLQIFAEHNKYENDKVIGEVKLDLSLESSGTNRLLAVGGLILSALSDGTTIIIDELERSLHPYLTKILIELFNNPKTNPHNAQLIFTTHDISILTSELFRRDQIWFSEKNEKGYTSFYSLGDINGVRKDVPYYKYYMKGLFGGIPNVNFYDFNFVG